MHAFIRARWNELQMRGNPTLFSTHPKKKIRYNNENQSKPTIIAIMILSSWNLSPWPFDWNNEITDDDDNETG